METLPVELLYRIFDYLDAETIVCSIRPVCRFFRSVVQTYRYHRYVLDFTLISKSNFYALCRLINPEDVISLVLSNDRRTADQIALFISLVDLPQFTRLCSLTLFDVDEYQMNLILKPINLNLLISFSCKIRTYSQQYRETTNNILELIIGQPNLQRLELNLESIMMWRINWPIDCAIQYLIINGDTYMTDIGRILQHSPRLHTFILKQDSRHFVNVDILIFSSLTCFRQLRSFTIECYHIPFDELLSFLLLTPALDYLKVICTLQVEMFQVNRWKEFVEMYLTQLNQLEFYFSIRPIVGEEERDLELIISSFRTPFWIEEKKWFVTCECDLLSEAVIRLYSIPICKSYISYTSKSTKMMVSTYPALMNNDQLLTNNINSLELILDKSMAEDIREINTTANHSLFPQVTDIYIQFDSGWSSISLEALSLFIDVSRITSMKISNSLSYYRYDHDTLVDMFNFLEQLPNLSILTIEKNLYSYSTFTPLENIYPFLPRHVKHLRIRINCLEQIEIVLKRCQNLVTIIFDHSVLNLTNKIKTWFSDNSVNTTCEQTANGTVFVWFGKIKNSSTDESLFINNVSCE